MRTGLHSLKSSVLFAFFVTCSPACAQFWKDPPVSGTSNTCYFRDSFLSGSDIQTTDWSLPSQMSSRCLASNRFLSRASCSFLSSASLSVLLCLLRTPRALMTSLLAKAAEVSGRSLAGWRNSAQALALALAALVACDKGRIFTMACLIPRASRVVTAENPQKVFCTKFLRKVINFNDMWEFTFTEVNIRKFMAVIIKSRLLDAFSVLHIPR